MRNILKEYMLKSIFEEEETRGYFFEMLIQNLSYVFQLRIENQKFLYEHERIGPKLFQKMNMTQI